MPDLKKLKQEQLKLAKKVLVKDDIEKLEYIAGVDQSFVDNKIISCIVLLKYDTLEFVEKKVAVKDALMPYIPGFLSYREAPAIIEAFNMLETKPDLLMVDGNGILHPLKIGLASHLGIILDIPTIGVAKSLLLGEEKDGMIYVENDKRAFVMETKDKAKPVYVSPGHKVNFSTAKKIFEHCMKGNKMPLPLHLAHKFAAKTKNKLKKE